MLEIRCSQKRIRSPSILLLDSAFLSLNLGLESLDVVGFWGSFREFGCAGFFCVDSWGGGGNPGGEGVRGDGFGEIGVGGREKMREEEGEGQEIEQKCKCRL